MSTTTKSWLWWLLIPILLVLLGASAGLVLWSNIMLREHRIEETWTKALGGVSLVERYPPIEANDTALQLEEVAAKLGIGLAPTEKERNLPTEGAQERFGAIEELLEEHTNAIRVTVDGSLPTPPDEVVVFLESARPALRDAVEILHAEQAPVWERDLAQGYAMPVFSAHGQHNLRRLLVLTAAEDARRGQEEEALRVLEALWRLAAAIRQEPMLPYWLIGISGHKATLPALRTLCSVPPDWHGRLTEIDLRQEASLGLQVDTWSMVASGRKGELDHLGIQPPLLRLGAIQTAELMERSLADIGKTDLRTFDPDVFFKRQFATVPRWNSAAVLILAPNLWDIWAKVGHLELGFELTSRVFEVRKLLAAGDRAALERLAGTHPSRIEGLSWIYELRHGAVSIRLDSGFEYSIKRPLPHEIQIPLVACGA
ncbi:MAG: hypothetical protein GY856_33740 [bacterium]|nr:hypothetical protein [bacterium]